MKAPTVIIITITLVISVAALIDFRLWWALDNQSLFGGAGQASFATPADEGQHLFGQKCVACHTVGGGDRVGPDLKDILTRREKPWVARFIKEPDVVLASGDPIATDLLKKYKNVPMTNLDLSKREIDAIVAYLEGPKQEAAPTAAPAIKGDPAAGRKLFAGMTHLANGGPACMSCHNVNGVGRYGGGTVGPDLTTASRFGAAGIAGILEGLPYPAMQPIYRNKLLTKEEQAHLAAFLMSVPPAAPAPFPWKFLGAVALGFLFFVVTPGIVWRRRNRGIRQPLVEACRR